MTPSPRFQRTMAAARYLRATGERFDKSWRHANRESLHPVQARKAAFYARVSAVAANDIADNPWNARIWRKAL